MMKYLTINYVKYIINPENYFKLKKKSNKLLVLIIFELALNFDTKSIELIINNN